MTNIILVNPPVQAREYMSPPIGLAYLAAMLEEHKHKVEILDATALGLTHDGIGERVGRCKPDFVGISAMTPSFSAAIETAKAVRKISDAKIILGGPHATLIGKKLLEECEQFDALVVGEGEYAMLEIADKRSFEGVAGVAYRKGKRIVSNKPREPVQDLDKLPFPARHLLPQHLYRHPAVSRYPFTTMATSRGCPYNCIYCCKAVTGSRYRARSPENVVAEIEHLVRDYGIKEIIMHDDIFTLDSTRTEGICDLLIGKGLDVTWKCETRVDRVDKGLLSKMKAAGCTNISYGVESGNQRILDNLRKRITLDQIRKAFRWTHEAGIGTLAYMIIGSPGETKETIEETIRFAIELDPDYVQFSIMTPFPNTDLFRLGERTGMLKKKAWDGYLFFGKGAEPVFVPEGLTAVDLKKALSEAYKRFYLRPAYVWKMARKTRDLATLKVRFVAALNILRG